MIDDILQSIEARKNFQNDPSEGEDVKYTIVNIFFYNLFS